MTNTPLIQEEIDRIESVIQNIEESFKTVANKYDIVHIVASLEFKSTKIVDTIINLHKVKNIKLEQLNTLKFNLENTKKGDVDQDGFKLNEYENYIPSIIASIYKDLNRAFISFKIAYTINDLVKLPFLTGELKKNLLKISTPLDNTKSNRHASSNQLVYLEKVDMLHKILNVSMYNIHSEFQILQKCKNKIKKSILDNQEKNCWFNKIDTQKSSLENISKELTNALLAKEPKITLVKNSIGQLADFKKNVANINDKVSTITEDAHRKRNEFKRIIDDVIKEANSYKDMIKESILADGQKNCLLSKIDVKIESLQSLQNQTNFAKSIKNLRDIHFDIADIQYEVSIRTEEVNRSNKFKRIIDDVIKEANSYKDEIKESSLTDNNIFSNQINEKIHYLEFLASEKNRFTKSDIENFHTINSEINNINYKIHSSLVNEKCSQIFHNFNLEYLTYCYTTDNFRPSYYNLDYLFSFDTQINNGYALDCFAGNSNHTVNSQIQSAGGAGLAVAGLAAGVGVVGGAIFLAAITSIACFKLYKKYFKKPKSDNVEESHSAGAFDALSTTNDVSNSSAAPLVQKNLNKEELSLQNINTKLLPEKYSAKDVRNQFEIAQKCLLLDEINTGLSASEIYCAVVSGKIPEDITIDFAAAAA